MSGAPSSPGPGEGTLTTPGARRTVAVTQIVLPGLVEPAGLLVREATLAGPGPGQALVRVEATGISFAEQGMRRGRYYRQPPFPFVPGYDLVGTGAAVGPGADAALVGRRVAALTKVGGWSSYVLHPAVDLVEVPAGVDPAAAETVVVNGITAWQMLHRDAQVRAGQIVLVHGANGGVGTTLVQLARHAGARVIGTASPRHHDELRALGVLPVDYHDPDLRGRVREIAPNGVDAVFDHLGGPSVRRSWRMLAPGGTLVSYGLAAQAGDSGSLLLLFLPLLARLQAWDLLPNGRHAKFYDLWGGRRRHPEAFRARFRADLARVLALLRDGVITAQVAARFPLTEAAAAMELAESRTVLGKVILEP